MKDILQLQKEIREKVGNDYNDLMVILPDFLTGERRLEFLKYMNTVFDKKMDKVILEAYINLGLKNFLTNEEFSELIIEYIELKKAN